MRHPEIISYRHHPDFDNPDLVSEITRPMDGMDEWLAKSDHKGSIDPLWRMAKPLLTREQEKHLFRQYNYYRFKGLAKKSIESRNIILLANIRLVFSLAGKNRKLLDGLDNAVSEGVGFILKAIDRFDVNLGFRFSTFATWVVHHGFGDIRKKKDNDKNITNRNEDLLKILEKERPYPVEIVDEQNNVNKILKRLEQRYNKRYVEIVRMRTGLERNRHSRKEVAAHYSISRQRVHQIETLSFRFIAEEIKKWKEQHIETSTESSCTAH